MNIKLSSVQMIDELKLGCTSGTFVKWTHQGFIKGTRNEGNGKRGGNFWYSIEELRRIKDCIKKFGVNNLPESLTENYIPKEPKVKIRIPKIEINDINTLNKILKELQDIKQISQKLYDMWQK